MSSEVSAPAVEVNGELISSIAEPSSIAEVSDVLRQARDEGTRLLIASGGTRLVFGNQGGPFDLVLSLRQLNRVIHYEPDDMTLAVEPGCTIAQIDELLGANRQFIALDVARPERATIGGSYATGLSGPRRLGGGSLKDWVIGVEVAGVDGAVSRAGGMVVKNVTGYDMMHLHYGALGAFGVVTRLNLKVFPAPDACRSIALSYASPVDAHRAGLAILGSQLLPSSVLVANDEGWRLHVRVDAPQSAIGRLVERFVETAATGASAADVSISDSARDALRPFTAAVDLLAGRSVARLPVTAIHQLTVIEHLQCTADLVICADPGSGLIYVTAESVDAIDGALVGIDATPTWLARPAGSKVTIDVFGGMTGPAMDVARRLKDAFDPSRQLNPGRFVLGL